MLPSVHTLRAMPAALELLSGSATAPGATQTALTMATGNTLTIRNSRPGSLAWLLQVWADVQGAGVLRVRSPNLHDNNQGIRLDTVVGDVTPLLPFGHRQKLYPQDTLSVDISGSAVAGDIENVGLLVYYEDLVGADAQFRSWADIANRIENVVTVENTLATGVAGGYSGEEALDAEFDLLKANTSYALLGYLVDTECASVRWRGTDVSNYGVGGPGEPALRFMTSEWFIRLSDHYGLPLIPVFNAANKSGILIDAVQDENGADPTVTSIFAELAG